MNCLSPWDYSQGERTVVETVLPPAKKVALGGGVPRDVGSVVIRYVGFIGVTGRFSEFGGRLSLP